MKRSEMKKELCDMLISLKLGMLNGYEEDLADDILTFVYDTLSDNAYNSENPLEWESEDT